MTEDNPIGPPSASIMHPYYPNEYRPPVYPGFPLPNSTGANTTPKEPKTVDILMIWVTDVADPDRVVWLDTAWDRDTVDANPKGWQEKIDAAHKEWGGANVRIAITKVDIDAIDAAFEPVRA